jgi:DNA-nicking Smr family endonuclease
MRNNKPGLGDLKRLQRESAAARPEDEARRQEQASRDAQILKSRQSDALLFARAVQSVQPLSAATRLLHTPSQTLAREDAHTRMIQRRQRATAAVVRTVVPVSDLAGAPDESAGDLSFAVPGVGPDTLRRLRQAFWPVGAELDLHGYTADKAREALAQFIDQSRACGTRCVRVIHGVGHGSARGQPVLRARVAAWLTQLSGVQAYATAPSAHGGRGAVMVLLRLS